MQRIVNKLNGLSSAKTYGVFVLYATMAIALRAQTYTTLLSFDFKDGGKPQGQALVQATNGYLYGIASAPSDGNGTVFRMTTGGVLTTIHKFHDSDGSGPNGLVQANNGEFYGTTSSGGANLDAEGIGAGTFFKMTAGGALTTLYSFCAQSGCTDGEHPIGLVQATNGDFYGMTTLGGTTNQGTIFKITPSGTPTTLVNFDGTNGYAPNAALIQATDGNFYGTTFEGGANCTTNFPAGCGTLFKMTRSGTLTTLYSFCSQTNCTDGAYPSGPLVQANNGDIYGITEGGGPHLDAQSDTAGTVFKITQSGTLTTGLYNFCSQTGCMDGAAPAAGLVQGSDGNLYGTTEYGGTGGGDCGSGGTLGCGTIFVITPGGTPPTLFGNFCAQSDCPHYPEEGLAQDTNGVFYGTTAGGGADDKCPPVISQGCGTVFSFSVGPGPFVETRPTSGAVGSTVTILGTNLTGATSVTFNGVAAVFSVVSSSEITTTVPTGATSGTVEVVTSSTLSSNVPFRVP